MTDDTNYCREQALKCANRAIRADKRRERKALTQAAQVWLKMALEMEARLDAASSKARTGFAEASRPRSA